jgi:hypothetical protein
MSPATVALPAANGTIAPMGTGRIALRSCLCHTKLAINTVGSLTKNVLMCFPLLRFEALERCHHASTSQPCSSGMRANWIARIAS